MQKDAFYFPHFSNARHDRKLKRVIKELGVEGYGIYFMILEVLRDQDSFIYPLDDIDLLADEFGTSEQKVRTVICNYKLFQVDEDNMFFSVKFNEFMQPYLNMKEQRRQAGIKSGEARRQKALTKKSTNDRSTDVQRELNEIEQSKVNKVKKKNIYSDNDELNKAILDFIDMRIKIKKPMTKRAITLLINKLNSLADNDKEKVLILEQSILNNWQSLYELKIKPKTEPKQNGKAITWLSPTQEG